MPEPLDTLQKRWDSSCKILFGEQIGNLSDFAPWLSEHIEPFLHKKSSLSGKDVTYSITKYEKNSKYISFDEIDFGKIYSPPNLNAKNMDELISSISDRFYYAGNALLGKCGYIEKSSNLDSCFYMNTCARFLESRYCAYSNFGGIGSEDCFGCNGLGDSSVCIKCHETYNYRRCFELWWSQSCSDCHYSYGLNNCQDCMFCFHLKNKRYCIANTQFSQEEYHAIKKKLLAQMAAELKKNKRLPSIYELLLASQIDKSKLPPIPPAKAEEKTDISKIDEAFSKTSAVLLGKPLGKIKTYEKWLSLHKRRIEKYSSFFSSKPVYAGEYCNALMLPKDRLVCADEALMLGEHLFLEKEKILKMDFIDFKKELGKIGFFSPEYYAGSRANIIECPQGMDVANCYRVIANVFAKYCAIGMWPRHSEYIFGFDACLKSKFCINCYESHELTRCFEMDNCRTSTDCYFCHNIENCQECMFCFNIKAKRYAIGNVEVGKEKFMQVKKMVLNEISSKLEKNKSLEYDIYSIGSKK